ncbi:integrase catalytic domain-containing protein [Nephila pilipes]|uniref:Integrase catalytic domain-containing protein n=1 Tax=Nephila pilipes TaxID=299642 RepID=A0A8X6U0Z8_NEPPI|nr:integrase catalytic domain-containing protein [Nephila pilipes]
MNEVPHFTPSDSSLWSNMAELSFESVAPKQITAYRIIVQADINSKYGDSKSQGIRRLLPVEMLNDHARFAHINIDFIAPMAPSDGHTLCMTIVNRFLRWSEAMPTTHTTAETKRKAIIHNLIPHFDCQVTVTTDQGRNFD